MKKYMITVNGNAYEVQVEEMAADSEISAPAVSSVAVPKAAAPADGTPVKSPMPGTVLKIKVQTGTSVKKGDVILILEAMKMENDIVAPCDGVIKSINASQGQSVNTGDILAVLG